MTNIVPLAPIFLSSSPLPSTLGKNLEIVTQEITGGMNEMATGADQINIAVNEVNDLTIKNHDKVDILMAEVSRFKVL